MLSMSKKLSLSIFFGLNFKTTMKVSFFFLTTTLPPFTELSPLLWQGALTITLSPGFTLSMSSFQRVNLILPDSSSKIAFATLSSLPNLLKD